MWAILDWRANESSTSTVTTLHHHQTSPSPPAAINHLPSGDTSRPLGGERCKSRTFIFRFRISHTFYFCEDMMSVNTVEREGNKWFFFENSYFVAYSFAPPPPSPKIGILNSRSCGWKGLQEFLAGRGWWYPLKESSGICRGEDGKEGLCRVIEHRAIG